MNLRPVNDFVIIEPIEADKTTKSGIILPEGAKEAPAMGKVLSGEYEGKTVFYKKWMDQEIEVDGKKYKIVKAEDILATYE